MAEGQEGTQLERAPFVIVPFELVQRCADRKGTLLVYCHLWHHAGTGDKAYPSAERQARECRMKRDDVFEARAWLEAEGWIRKETRPGQTTLYHVRTENPSPKRGVPPKKGSSPKRGVPPVPQKGDTNKNQLTRTNKNPLTPMAQGDFPIAPIAALAPDPHPDARSVVRSSKPTEAPDPYRNRQLPPQAIPDALVAVADLLEEYWASKKTRSERIFKRICRDLISWDPDYRRQALEHSISGSYPNVYPPRPSAASSRPGNALGLPVTGADMARQYFEARRAS